MTAGTFSGQVALVTGGASGIGEAIVRRLAADGARVLFTDIDEAAGERVAGAAPETTRFLHADATSEADAERSVATALAVLGRLDIAVNNVGNFGAGDTAGAGLEDTAVEAWDNTLRQCLTSCMLGMKYALPPMLAAGSGSIVNIASLAGIRVTRYASYAYHAAKAGVVHLSEAAAVLYATRGIRVNVVAPGLTLTPNVAGAMPEELRASLVREFHPSQRMVAPEEIADAVAWAAAPGGAGATGLVIPVDGGWSAR
ncbi:SDR family NAD(P)-dependent oxidoreductase [Sphingopyxis sp. PET50]|uniref:SDR family NAD(P)-dependent oxidoreductase n=1 Tax=Sphingopyxis sp. PET50 TaxID=2976533 RepID=UPI0021AFA845|nr:SDR family NAD(P)-dependent oxidoreductase [Sphingopyxis sp. PET50]